jgi:membrane associated rhomboid family serine protease
MPHILLMVIAATAIISFISFNNHSLLEKYKFNISAIKSNKEYIRLVSAGFLHADFTHLLFNMITLYFFAPTVINVFGAMGFLIIYFGAIISGNIFSLFLYKNQGWYSAIGASGGVSGILFAAIAVFPHIGIGFIFIPISIPGYVFGLLYFGYSVYMMLNPRPHDNVGHAAHLGGAIFGLLFTVINVYDMVISNALYLIIMALPLMYLSYQIFIKKKIF